MPLNPTGRCSRLYHSKNSYDCQFRLTLEKSGSFSASSWVESFVRQSLSFIHSSFVMQCSRYRERETLSSGGWKIKWDSFWKAWDNSRSLFNCSLVHVLIISSTKWETLKTDKSTPNYVLSLVSRSWTYWLSLLSAFSLESLNLSSFFFFFFFFPVVKMNMVVSSQLLQHYRTESHTTYSSDNRPQTGYFVSAVQLW